MQKHANLVDLDKSFPTSIYLQNSASIQPRTSLSKFAKKWPQVRIKFRKTFSENLVDDGERQAKLAHRDHVEAPRRAVGGGAVGQH